MSRNFQSWKTGVFEETVNGITVGYFVGWKGRRHTGARNIREGLYFETAKQAIDYRDHMEDSRVMLSRNMKQIA